jgi:Protein of unknown function (DUF3106)
MTRRSDTAIRGNMRRGTKALAILVLALSLGLGGAAALSSVEHRLTSVNKPLTVQAAAAPQKPSAQNAQKKSPAGPVQRMGEWLESHKNLPLDQQEKALESDPKFKKLTPDRQNALRERLRKFNSLPPDQRDQALKRMDFWGSLSKEQRQQLRDANQKLQALPEDRRVAIHKALRHLRQMNPQQREQVMQSDRFKTTFSDQEQGILKQLAAINPPENGRAQQPSLPAGQAPRHQ